MTNLLQPKEAAALAGISKVALWKAWKRGDISPVSVTPQGVPSYEVLDIKAWLKRRAQRASLAPVRGGVRTKIRVAKSLSKITNPLVQEVLNQTNSESLTKEAWINIHSKCVAAKHLGAKLLKYSRESAIERWGADFVADIEVGAEMDLGVVFSEEGPRLNPADKSTGITTIQAIAASFSAWHRKMEREMRTWGPDKRKLAKLLMEPIAAAHARL